jgi:hypothetical protein
MTYQLVDQALTEWLGSHPVHMSTEYKGEEVRSFDVVSPTGDKVQVWIDPLGSGDQVQVHVWDYRRRRQDLTGNIADVARLIDTAYETARQWLGESSMR